MTQINSVKKTIFAFVKNYFFLLYSFCYGLLLPLAFAPVHMPGAALLSIALLYTQICHQSSSYSFLSGLFFGLGYFGLGTSWIFISIHEYGQLNYFIAALITLLLLIYLSLFPALMVFLFKKINIAERRIFSCFLFTSLWILFEYFRASFLTGFPWLLLGFSQFDAPAKYLFPIVGTFGVGFQTCLAATILATSFSLSGIKRMIGLITFISLVLFPLLFHYESRSENKNPLSVGIIQANLSMRDKWDEELFWKILGHYQQKIEQLLGTELIVMPESAIPLPENYIEDFLIRIDSQAKQANSAILLGILKSSTSHQEEYFNALMGLGKAKGFYLKQHLVPFGEYIPPFFHTLVHWLGIPDAHLTAGQVKQPLVKVQNYSIATLICYELAYDNLLRQQLPEGQWIVSITDAGWFGHSFAPYQLQQIAQVLSLETGRYQVVVNNNGLSAVLNTRGEIIASLPAFSDGILKTTILPATGTTPWVRYGHVPILSLSGTIVLFCIICRMLTVSRRITTVPIAANYKRRYSYQPK